MKSAYSKNRRLWPAEGTAGTDGTGDNTEAGPTKTFGGGANEQGFRSFIDVADNSIRAADPQRGANGTA